ncbi:hypothetical protein PAE9249_01461 [Paenibacillus sp. CECT 9249]|uniref:PadR family transcriptional regulator n=1 Tax=Paenibacillus sp. CECT 9249 TaxID=2845385 RepID=UPI001E56EB47|nr:PadR family transcriptional regulator [Paenibacillus sp. CECT 9249]CAH0118964.1 hypothetical protein PAE9249_01461 [Paenibacillus sp. CECT 9249]
MNIQNVILGFLLDGPMAGYDLKGKFDESVSYFFEATFSGIYPALRKMEGEGLVIKEVMFQEGKPNKNVYAITNKGREAFAEYLASPVAQSVQRSDLLLRIYFGSHCSDEQIVKWLAQERARLQDGLAHLSAMREALLANPATDPFRMKTLSFGIEQLQLSLQWVDNELANYSEGGRRHER